ncbi:MAG: enoyl-CoA hydratase-related protein, partial [Bacteroidota bacterium]|nr:enoyl-CoA hydratase-related protein [Bacteroidota bacterium]
QLNALNGALIAELGRMVEAVQDREEVRCVILTGSGEKAFVAGADIKEFADFNGAEGRALAERGQRTLFDAIALSRTPFLAAIGGFALGGGLELALACHIRIASDTARMGLPEVTLGLIPGYGGTQRLARIVGSGRAMEMILSARMVKADEALSMGLVSQVVEQPELLDHALDMAARLTANSPNAQAAAIRAVQSSGSAEGFEVEIDQFGRCFEHPNFKEGVAAFLEKRKPAF